MENGFQSTASSNLELLCGEVREGQATQGRWLWDQALSGWLLNIWIRKVEHLPGYTLEEMCEVSVCSVVALGSIKVLWAGYRWGMSWWKPRG